MTYNIVKVEELVTSALVESELKEICRSHFPAISDDVSSDGLRKSQRVEILIDYVKRSDKRIETLLLEIKKENLALYQDFEPDLTAARSFPIADRTNQPPIPSHLPYLCDRSYQEQDLKDAFKQRRENPPKSRQPLLCIVHGSETECHDSFVSRISDPNILHKLSKPEKRIDKVDQKWFEFPQPKGSRRDYLKRLTQILEETAEEILTVRSDSSVPLLLWTNIHTKDWRFGGQALIKSFIEFWNTRPPLPNQLLIVFLCINYRTGAFNWLSRLRCRKFLQRLHEDNFSEFTDLHTVLLTELKAVEKDDAEDWARKDIVRSWARITDEQDLVNSVQEIYERNRRWLRQRNEMPMKNLAVELRKLFPN